jgi:hypothetical protein
VVRGIDRKLCVSGEFWPEKLNARLGYMVPVLMKKSNNDMENMTAGRG